MEADNFDQTLNAFKRRIPFRPFTVALVNGDRFEVDGQVLPPYFDPRYQCLMELLRFDSRKPNSKYLGLIDQVRDTLQKITVVARESVAMATPQPAFPQVLAS